MRRIKRRNWVAIAIASVIMMVSLVSYAAAFARPAATDGAEGDIEPMLVAIGLTLAPFVFVVCGFVSQNARAPKQILWAMLLLLGVGLGVGLIDPLLGASTGFAAGGAATLRRPPVERVMTWRTGAVVFTCLYLFVLFVIAPPAAVLAAVVLPLVLIGFADEYAVWSADRPERTGTG